MNISLFQPPPAELPLLTDNAIHLWLASLDTSEALQQRLERWLSPDERERAARYMQDRHRMRFIAGRGMLRGLLGQYLRIDPSKIAFDYNQFGKPVLASGGMPDLYFNLSHSRHLALFAFTRAGEIGVDIEFISARTRIDDVSGMVFSPPELAVLKALGPEARRSTFFTFWARKEAFIKVSGAGFSMPLEKFDVSRIPDAPVAFLDIPDAKAPFPALHIRDIHPIPGFSAALASAQQDTQVLYFSLPDLHFS